MAEAHSRMGLSWDPCVPGQAAVDYSRSLSSQGCGQGLEPGSPASCRTSAFSAMEAVLHASPSAPPERTLLYSCPWQPGSRVVPIHILSSLPMLSLCLSWLPPVPFKRKDLVFCFKATLRAEPRELHPP